MSNYLNVKEVAGYYGVGVQTIWRWTRENKTFPQPVRPTHRCTRWLRSDLAAHQEHLIAMRGEVEDDGND